MDGAPSGTSLEGSFAGILHTKNDTLADAVKDEGTDILFGREHFKEELLGLRFQISPFSFFPDELIGRGGAVRENA